jgi:choice-of-anchor A domain-containing protein
MTRRPPARSVALGDRTRRVVAATIAAVLALVGAVVLVSGPQARPASAALGFCPDPGDMPNIGQTPPLFTDSNVTVYSGGDYRATASAAESEGLLVVAGEATIDAPGNFSIGAVGAGSQITPPDGAVMLAVGGGLGIAAGTGVTVGSTLPNGGAVNVGGTVTGGGTLSTAGTTPGADAPVTEGMGPAAVADWAGFGDVIADASVTIAGWPTTAAGVVAGNRVTFTGSGADDPQVFTVGASELAGVREVVFANIPEGVAVAINVVGSAPVSLSPNYWEGNGSPFINDFNSNPRFGDWAARTLWNFESTPELALGRADQFLGTILAPVADATIMTSTNGRVLVGGDLTFGDPGVEGGLEMHSYPWIGPGPFDCTSAASFVVQKTVTGEAAADVPSGTTFEVGYTYEEPDGTTGGDTLVVPISGALVNGPTLPVGTVVTVAETDLPSVPGVEWGTPVIQVNGEPLGDPAQLTIQENRTVTVTVVNTANGGAVPTVGGFSVAKAVTGDAAGLVPADTAFLVDWEAGLPEGAAYDGDLSGTLTVLADGTVTDGPSDLPVGTTVALAERTPLPEVDGVEWGEPVFSPASPVTIVEGATGVAVTLTNVADAVVGGFTVRKAIEGGAAGAVPGDTAFLVDWTATVPAGVVHDGETTGTLTVLADGTVANGPTDLPVGTTVTLTEQQPLPGVDGVVWGLPTLEPASPVTIVEGPTGVSVTVTNTADAPETVGGFAVQKSLAGDASGAVPPGTAFVVAWTAELPDGAEYDGSTSGTVTVLADGTVVDGPQDLPEGTVVTFTEQTIPGVPGVDWGTPTVSPGTVTIGDGDAVAGVVVTNTATAQTGGFSIAKAVEGSLAGSVPPGTEFDVEWSATLPVGFTYDGPLTGTLTVLADGTVVDGPQDLPVGTVVTFTEINLPEVDGVVWGAPTFSPETVTVGDEENTLVTLTNTTQDVAEVGGFSVAKEVTGDRADLVPADTEFTVAYSYELDGTLVGGYLQVPADGTVVAGPQNLPVGTVVTYTEADLPDIPGVAWGVPTFSPQSVVVGVGENTLVTATNTANQAVGGFSLLKRVTGEAADAVPATTEFVVGYAYDSPTGPVTGSLTVRADGTAVDGPQDLPTGTVVRLTETDLPEIGGVDWGTPTFTVDGTAVTEVTVGDGTVVVTLTNTAEDEGLAVTGTDAVLVTTLALLFMGTGAALLAIRARRGRTA